MKHRTRYENYHFGFLPAKRLAKVPRPLAAREDWKSSNLRFAYLLVSEPSTSSSTKVRLRSARVRFSELAVPNGVEVGTIVPIYNLILLLDYPSSPIKSIKIHTANCAGSPLIPLPSPDSLR